jgi:DNA-binding CsgD family transcriptional regulator
VLEEKLAAARAGHPQMVSIEADPGSGKSTLLSHFTAAVDDATVLSVSADADESVLSYGVVDQLRSSAPTDPGTDPMIVGAELVELLDELQRPERVVVLVIDDLQWIDRPSLRAVLFALRRLRADTVLTVVATRLDTSGDSGWARFVAGDSRVTRVRLQGFEPDDLVDLARGLDLGTLTRRGAARLLAHTDGNPLYCRALLEEIGVGVLNASGDDALPAPRDLSAVILSRVAALSGDAQQFLAAASVIGLHVPVRTVASVAGLADGREASDEAVTVGLLVESPSAELSFMHPLYRAAIYADLSPTNRRRLHAEAANVVDGRSILVHRVAAAPGADEVLANELEAAWISATDGDATARAWALERAALLSSDGTDRERRLLDAAAAHLGVADTEAAARVLASCQLTSARRDALTGLVGVYMGSPTTEARLTAAWTAHDPVTEPTIGTRAATSLSNWMVVGGRPEEGVVWAERALEVAEPASELWAMAKTAEAYSLGNAGRLSEALEVLSFLPRTGAEVPLLDVDALIMRGMVEIYADDLSGAIADLGVAAAHLRSGVPSTYPVPCFANLSEAHFRRGDWDAAMTYAQLAMSVAQDADRPFDLVRAHARSAQVLAARGQWSDAEERVTAARADSARFPAVLAVATCAVAGVALASARRDPAGVLAAIEPVRATDRLSVGGRPGIFNWRTDEIDALIALDRLQEAETARREFEGALSDLQIPSALLMLARSEGNLSRATGDSAGSESAFLRGHAIAPRVSMPFELALLHLDDGRRLRQRDRQAEAIVQLERAHRLFSDLGADPYVRQCADELQLLQVSATATSPEVTLGLSRAEMAVARLVATGLTNREVAGELYVSVKTVEYHLRNSFIKLDITSRRQLASLLQ